MLFRRKAKAQDVREPVQGLSEEFSLDVLNDAEEEHRAKLKSEVRTCPTCSYEVVNPMTDKCPRCFSTVPLSEHTNCGECDYKGNCALAEIHRPS